MGSSSLHDPSYMHIQSALRDMREAIGLTQRDLGERLNKHHSYVHKSEAGERKVDPLEWARWCVACETDPAKAYRQLLKKFEPVL